MSRENMMPSATPEQRPLSELSVAELKAKKEGLEGKVRFCAESADAETLRDEQSRAYHGALEAEIKQHHANIALIEVELASRSGAK